jgi:hypothetical protein
MTGLTIDFETADRITLLTMQESLERLEKEVEDHLEKGEYMHPEDLQESMIKYIPALKTLIKYYGGPSYEL